MATHGFAVVVSGSVAGRYATTLWPVLFSRTTSACTAAVTSGIANPAACGFASSRDFCTSSRRFPAAANILSAVAPLIVTATMPEPAIAVSNVIGASSPAFGDRGPVTTIMAFAPCWRAAIAL